MASTDPNEPPKNFRSNSSSLAGLSTPGYSPRVRIRIKDMFSKNVNSVLGMKGPQLKMPSMTLDKTVKVGSADGPLISMDVTRQMGVTGGNTARLTFTNKDGKLYRNGVKKQPLNTPGQGIGIGVILPPTIDEEALFANPAAPSSNGPLTANVAQYLNEVIKSQLMATDISPTRQQLITKIRKELSGFQEITDLNDLASKNKNIIADLLTLMRVELMFDKMAPIEIDMQDTKGRWFGVFTGFIASVEDDVPVGDMPTVTVTALDKMAYFARTLAVIRNALTPAAETQTTSEGLQHNRDSLIYNDNLDSLLMWQLFILMVKLANSAFTAQGYYENIALARSSGSLSNLIQVSNTASGFTSEQYGSMYATWIRMGLGPLHSKYVVPQDRIYESGLLSGVGVTPNTIDTTTRFWHFDHDLLSPGLQEQGGRSEHVRLFRLWTLPNWQPGDVQVQPTKISLTPVTINPPKDSKTFPLIINKVDGSRPEFLSFADYRGLSPYWPYQTLQNGKWGGLAEQFPYYPGNAGLPIVTQPMVTATTKLKQSFTGNQTLASQQEDFNVPFRDVGIAQFDQIFNPMLTGGYLNTGLPVEKQASSALRSSWSQFLNGTAPGLDKLANLEQMTYANIYTTGLGDLVFALPRWNQVPLANMDSIEAGPDKVLVSVNPTLAQEFGLDRQDFYHGREYIMGDFGMVGRRINTSEEGVYSSVHCQTTVDILGSIVPADITPLLNLSGSLQTDALQAIFGDRRLTISAAITTSQDKPALPSKNGVMDTPGDAKKIAQNLASCVQTAQFFRPNTLDITYKIPKPIELGRTVFVPDNCYLYYVTSITRSWKIGEDYTESYHGEYGHPVWYFIPIPWVTRMNDFQGSVAQLAGEISLPTSSPSSDASGTPFATPG